MPYGVAALNLATDQSGRPLDAYRIGTAFTVAFDASTASTSTMATYAGTTGDDFPPFVAVRVTATTACFVTSAASPTALANGTHHYLPAGVPQDLVIPAAHKLAFIKHTTAGSAYGTVLK
jgi:hypothetical protein